MRLVIVGGVAGGASAAARARRLNEEAEIVLLERGPHVSFANCGLPYYIGREIADEADLLVQTPEGLHARFNLDVRVRHEAIAIDPEARSVRVRDLKTGHETDERYDALLLSPGASPLKPPIPGIDRPGHFTLRNIPDTMAIDAWLNERHVRRAVVSGAGYIGLEVAEQLRRRGVPEVMLVEALPQVMGALDPEMAARVEEELRAHGVSVYLGDPVAAFVPPAEGEHSVASTVVLRGGKRLPADFVAVGMGVRPETGLARSAGLEIGAAGGVRVDDQMRTSQPAIWAVGDMVETRHAVTGAYGVFALAGPANRQGRVAADSIMGRESRYPGTLATAIARVFDLTAAGTGANSVMLRRAGIPFDAVHVHHNNHAGYFPGASLVHLKVLFAPDTGRVLGAQAVGREGVDKRIDVLATAIRAGMKVDDLADLELAYAPPFNAARDPVNQAGMVAGNVLRGDVRHVQWSELGKLDPAATVLLDVRQPDEVEDGMLPGARNIPLPELRKRLPELPRDREIVVYCESGQRSYYACRVLSEHGYRCANLAGAWLTASAAPEPAPHTDSV